VRSAAEGYLALLSSQLVRLPLGMLNAALLARLLGPDGVGQWALLTATATALHSGLLNWTQAGGLRYGREEWASSGTVRNTWAGRWPWIAGGLGLSAAIMLPGSWTPFGRLIRLPVEWAPLVPLYVVSMWAMAEAQTLQQVTGRIGPLALVPVIPTAATATLLVGLASAHRAWSSAGVLATLVGVAVITWSASCAHEMRLARAGWPRPAGLARTFRFGWPLIPGFLAGYLAAWGDHLLLQAWFTVRDVGFFQAAYQATLLTAGLATPITTLLTPRAIDASRDPAALPRLLRVVFPTLAVLWAVAIVPVIVVLPAAFERLLGPSFTPARHLLVVLLALVPGAVVSQVYSVLFTVQGRLRQNVLILVAMTSINLGLSLALVPRFGAYGSCLATVVSYLASQLLYLVDQHRHVKVPMGGALSLFAALWAFGLLQLLVGPALFPRIALAVVAWTAFVALARRRGLADAAVIQSVLSGRLSVAAPHLCRLLVSPAGARP
jgi:O-antigen/teichoic acid export membrane protein